MVEDRPIMSAKYSLPVAKTDPCCSRTVSLRQLSFLFVLGPNNTHTDATKTIPALFSGITTKYVAFHTTHYTIAPTSNVHCVSQLATPQYGTVHGNRLHGFLVSISCHFRTATPILISEVHHCYSSRMGFPRENEK